MKLIINIDDKTYADIKKGIIYSSIRDVPQESVVATANGTPLDDIKAKILLKFAEQGTLVNANIFERCVKEVFKEYTDAK